MKNMIEIGMTCAMVLVPGATAVVSDAKADTSSVVRSKLPIRFLQRSDLAEASGIRLAVQIPKRGIVLFEEDPEQSSLWYSPSAARTLDDGSVQLWYQRVNKEETAYVDQRTLCLGEFRDGRWTLPSMRPKPPAWGGPNNIVMTRSPHKSTWGGFNVFQIIPKDDALEMLYWDQPNATGQAGALRAQSRDGKTWEKLPGAVFTEHNDAFCLIQIGDTYFAYQTALQSWPDKPVPDNIGHFKRVLTLRTSPDLQTWSDQQPLLAPDTEDAADAEFYLFKVFRYGRGYAGLIMKYYADPTRPGKHSGIYRHELAVSQDGRSWQRPFRDTDLGFWSYADPFTISGRMHFAAWKDGGMVTFAFATDRLVAATGKGSFRTHAFARPKNGIALNANASEGWVEAILCDGVGDPIHDATPFRIEGVDGISLPIPWTAAILPKHCSLRVQMGGRVQVFGINEQ